MANNLKISLIATLDKELSKDEINKRIKQIEGQFGKINLQIKLDDSVLKKIDGLITKLKEYGKVTTEAGKLAEEKSKKEAKAVEDLTKKYKLLREVKSHDSDGALKRASKTYQDEVGNSRVINTNAKGQVTGYRDTTDAVTKLQQAQEKLQLALKKTYDQGVITEQRFKRFNTMINSAKNVSEVEKVQKAMNRLADTGKNQNLQQKLLNQAQTLLGGNSKKLDVAGVNTLVNALKNIQPNATNASNQLKRLEQQLKNFQQQARVGAAHTLTFGNALKQALQGFSLWAMTAQMVYAPVRALQDMTQRLIEIDGLMTDIRRVMDMPDFKFTELLQEAVDTSDELSSKLTDVLKVMGDFGRMGFNESQLVDITKTAQVLQNISDLDATQSVDTLTSAMLNFNIAADDSMTIANKLNEVDNNFAISTKDLSDGIRKAAATAKTFGVDIDELTGYIAAIGSTTRESGSIVGNGLKTIFSRLTTIDGAEKVLNSANVAMHDMEGNVRPVSDIITDLAANWTTLTDEQRQNLGVTLAGRFQLTRFLALMNNFEIAQSATATAIDSSGSAMREQGKYADSLEARLNRLDTAWNKFTLAVGEAVLTDGLIGGIESLNDLATGVAGLVDKFGLLSGVFGIIGVATVALSTKFRTFTGSLLLGTTGMTRMQLASAGLTAGMGRLGIATIGVKTALRGLLASTVVGAVFVGIGFAIEKLIGKYSEAKQAQEDFNESQQKGIDALTNNKKETEQLIDQYNGLSEVKERSAKQEELFLSVQARLAELYPQLISYIDGSGQAHLKSREEIEKETKATNMLIEAKKLEAQADAKKNISSSINKRDDIDSEIKRIENELKNPTKIVGYGDGQTVVKKSEEDIKRLKSQLLIYQNQWSTAAQVVTNEVTKVADAYTDLQIDPNISQSVDTFFNSFDSTKLDSGQLEAFAVQIGNAKDALQLAYSSNNTDAFEKARESIKKVALEMGASEYQANAFALSFDGLKESVEKGAAAVFGGREGLDGFDESAMDATGSADAFANAMSGLASASGDVSKAFEGNISALDIYFGITSDQIQIVQQAINVYRALAGQASLTSYQQGMLTQATSILGNAFPYLNGKIDENIDWMATQAEVMGALGEISGDEATTLISNQNESTKVTIAKINERIKGYTEEAEALTKLIDIRIAEMEVDGQTGFRLDSYHRAKARLAELQGLIATASAELGNIVYQDAVDLGIIKPDGSDVGGSSGGSDSGQSDADKAAEEAARQKEQAIKDIISLYKDGYKMLQDVAIEGINKEKEAFEKAHEEKMKKLDDQLKLYEDIINKQIESIDKQEEEYNWNKRLSDSQSDRQDIIDEMNKLQLDNSFSAKKRMDELNVRLAEIDSGISDMQHEREVELRKENLQSLLEDKQLQTEQNKNVAQTNYDNGLLNFDKRIAAETSFYDNLANNDRAFQEIANKINSNNNTSTMDYLKWFSSQIGAHSAEIGESISTNFMDAITRALAMLSSKNYGGSVFPTAFDTGGYTGSFGGSKGKMAMLHEKEIVLNKSDTSNFLKAIDITRNFFKGVSIPKLPSLQPSLAGAGTSLTLNFNVAKMSGDKSDVNFFMNEIVKGVNSMGGKL
jgi:TP901 family phage tail tape measure protein